MLRVFPDAEPPPMKPLVKTAVESALVALLVAGACLWFLISANESESANPGTIVMLSLGLAAGLIAHWTYMGLALKRDGRAWMSWMPAVVLLFPIATVVALVLMSAQAEESRAA